MTDYKRQTIKQEVKALLESLVWSTPLTAEIRTRRSEVFHALAKDLAACEDNLIKEKGMRSKLGIMLDNLMTKTAILLSSHQCREHTTEPCSDRLYAVEALRRARIALFPDRPDQKYDIVDMVLRSPTEPVNHNPLPEIRRFGVSIVDERVCKNLQLTEHADGELVYWEDVVEKLSRKDSEIAELRWRMEQMRKAMYDAKTDLDSGA
jgi:hypothetical protein